MLVEEHGSGRQLDRIQLWPTPPLSAAGLVLGGLVVPGTLAAVDGAWAAAAMLGAAALLLAALMAQQSEAALGADRGTLEDLGARSTSLWRDADERRGGKEHAEVQLGYRLVPF